MAAPLSKKEMAYYASVCASFNFRKAARAVTQLFDTTLQPTGLRSTQLVILLAAGIHEKPTMSLLAETIISDRTTLTRALKPLFRQGLLENIPGKDKRKNGIFLTPKGHHAVRRALPYWKKAQKRIVKSFGRKQWEDLLVKLAKAVQASRAA
jgi:DNA-binding MarR family transcriptional regulator